MNTSRFQVLRRHMHTFLQAISRASAGTQIVCPSKRRSAAFTPLLVTLAGLVASLGSFPHLPLVAAGLVPDEKAASAKTDMPQETQQPAPTATAPNVSGPLVARNQLNLVLKGEVVDTIEVGDLLTVLATREDSYVIQTFSGHKGAVAKTSLATLLEAVEIYDKLIVRAPDEGRLYTLRAGAQFAAGAHEKALADYNKAINLGYEASHAFTSRGLFNAAMGNHQDAIRDYTEALQRDPDDVVPLVNRASVFVTVGEFDKAITDYTAASKVRSDDANLFAQRAVAHKLKGNLDEAVADYDLAIKLAPRDVAFILGRGFVKFQQGQYQEAIDDFDAAIKLAPDSAVAINNRGFNYQQLGDEKKALADYTQAAQLAPKYLLALRNLAWLITTSADPSIVDPSRAISVATDVCELTEYSDFSDLLLLAAAYARAEEFDTAIGWQEKAIKAGDAEQAKLAEQILQLYLANKPLDPKLLEAP